MPQRPRLAWFSPMPPVRSGVAVCNAELVPALRELYDVDVFVDGSTRDGPRFRAGTRSAHDFIWQHQRAPYDLTVFQLGNSSTHDFIWPYLVRYPGLAVLHDAHLHHARAAALLGARRAADYRAEFTWNHPEAAADLAELAVAGFDSYLHYQWPMTRLVVKTSRLVAVHGRAIARQVSTAVPDGPEGTVEPIRLGHGVAPGDIDRVASRARVRARIGLREKTILFGCFGGLSPDKRIPQILEAFAEVRGHIGDAHLLLAGGFPTHYDPIPDLARLGLRDSTTLTGYIASDNDLTAHIAACDVALTLRWPTAREISGPWLRCLAAGTPTIIVHLAHLADVPALDPRTWQQHSSVPGRSEPDGARRDPVAVAIDILDEQHSLQLAMWRLARDPALRRALSHAGQLYWAADHSLDRMVEDYSRIIPIALSRPAPKITVPEHLRPASDRTLKRLLEPFGLASPVASTDPR